ncbi:MAG TPA: SDR family oxidoreductase [Anaerolineae bacterium]|nr:SDR family oxidoreductase [Anaerolineae bacterium]
MNSPLAGKVVVITGGTRGLGVAMAEAFGDAGAVVVVGSRSARSVEEAVAHLTARGGRAGGYACDVSDLAQVQALKEHALTTFGQIDVWVNNAGTGGPYGPTAHIPPVEFETVLRTNIFGAYHGSWVALQHFLPQKHGKLINILGQGEQGPVAMQNAYASSKGWLRSFTLALAKEYADSGVGIFAFNPGMMATELLTQLDVVAGYEERLKIMPTIIRMFAKPVSAPAQKVVWLAGPATDGHTGMVVRQFKPWDALAGALREGMRRLLKQEAPSLEMHYRTIPAALGAEAPHIENHTNRQ